MRFVKEYRINLRDMGADFCAKRTTILHDFEECFAQMCLEQHITGYDLDKIGLMWVIGNINIEYLKDFPFWNEDIRIEIWFSEVKKLRAFLDFKAYWEDTLLAQGDSCWFVLNQQTRRPVAIDKIVEPCGIVQERVFDARIKNDFNKEESTLLSENNIIVERRDLDYNGHVNNVSYVDWMLIPENCKIKSYSINFAQECFLDERVTTKLYKNDNIYYFEVLKNDNSAACTIKSTVET